MRTRTLLQDARGRPSHLVRVPAERRHTRTRLPLLSGTCRPPAPLGSRRSTPTCPGCTSPPSRQRDSKPPPSPHSHAPRDELCTATPSPDVRRSMPCRQKRPQRGGDRRGTRPRSGSSDCAHRRGLPRGRTPPSLPGLVRSTQSARSRRFCLHYTSPAGCHYGSMQGPTPALNGSSTPPPCGTLQTVVALLLRSFVLKEILSLQMTGSQYMKLTG
mmetsp:Transcript_25655/g.50219  ORF Transcript_25655/g.50219 Transcript_25655/m.50219 type:complete len:215 (+) Transcript_25655:1376-2020(+)